MPRISITIEQRRALRRWRSSQTPTPSHKACIDWFYTQFNHKISQSTVSESLGAHFSHLDDTSTAAAIDSIQSRLRAGYWEDLEQILVQWQLRIEARGGFTTGEIIRQKAQNLWHQLSQYQGKPCPEFSERWLERYKKRHQIRVQQRFGEDASVPESTEDEMKALRTLAGEYNEEDIYNMDETGLFWRMTPSRGLSIQPRAGLKKDKSRISLVICTNATGSDKLPIWCIGKYKTPRALRNISVSTMGGEWRWNKKAWMNTAVMVDWLKAFYRHIGNRTVLLAMDNFSAHYTGLELCPPPTNIRICWLPPNSTSRFQPLDQGIIQNLKAYYRRYWLQYMIDCLEKGAQPVQAMNVHLALRWIFRSWFTNVSDTTIYNCFRKSTLVAAPITLPVSPQPADLVQLYQQASTVADIKDAMSLSNFLNPPEEAVTDAVDIENEQTDDALLYEIMEDHLQSETPEDEDEAGDSILEPDYSIQDARQALKVLLCFTEKQSTLNTSYVRVIERYEQELQSIERDSLSQGSLDRWLT